MASSAMANTPFSTNSAKTTAISRINTFKFYQPIKIVLAWTLRTVSQKTNLASTQSTRVAGVLHRLTRAIITNAANLVLRCIAVSGVAADAQFYITMHGVDDSNIGQEHHCKGMLWPLPKLRGQACACL